MNKQIAFEKRRLELLASERPTLRLYAFIAFLLTAGICMVCGWLWLDQFSLVTRLTASFIVGSLTAFVTYFHCGEMRCSEVAIREIFGP